MRYSVFTSLMTLAAGALFISGCDLLDKEVLIDKGEVETIIDSTSVRVLSSASDSTHLVVYTNAEWTAKVKSGTEGWCHISKDKGTGIDTVHIYVDENTTSKMRKTTIAIATDTKIRVYWITQGSADEWIDVTYWDRTAAQRLGLRGKVDTMMVSDSWHPVTSTRYIFDVKGNLLKQEELEKVTENNEEIWKAILTKNYRYDNKNHRLSCIVTDREGNELRSWRYEYENTAEYVPYGVLWADSDPLAEEMDGMIVPDLSAVRKEWTEDGYKMYETRTYTFKVEAGVITLDLAVNDWKDSLETKVVLVSDTTSITYQYPPGCMLSLPYKSHGNIINTTYYNNGMLKMVKTKEYSYEYDDNPQRMLITKYTYNGTAEHDVDSYECSYNSYHDITERRINYSNNRGTELEQYTQYQYDDKFNWYLRYEEISQHERYTTRNITYFKN